jgi:mRNA interferase RelE/StbE
MGEPAYEIRFRRSVLREIEGLRQPIRGRVTRAIQDLARDPRPHGAILLSGRDAIWRVRVGDYRILYRIHDDLVLVVVIRVRHRSEAYR